MAMESTQRIDSASNRGFYDEAAAESRQWRFGILETSLSLRAVVAKHAPGKPIKRLSILAHSPASNPMNEWEDLDGSVAVQVMLPDPNSEPYSQRCLSATVDPTHLRTWLVAHLGHKGHNWEVRLFSCRLDFAITIVDDLIFVRPYYSTKCGHFSPIVVLQPNDRTIYSQFERYFETMWRSSRPVAPPYGPLFEFESVTCGIARIFAHDADLRNEVATSDALVRQFPAHEARQVVRLREMLGGRGDGFPLPSGPTLERIHRQLRPVLAVGSDHRLVPEGSLLGTWNRRVDQSERLSAVFATVGLITFAALTQPAVGCLLVASCLVIAPAHVADAVKRQARSDRPARINFGGGLSAEAIEVRAQNEELALIRVAHNSVLPEPAALSSRPPVEGDAIWCVAHDGDTGAKEAAPGRVSRTPDSRAFEHDCTMQPRWCAGGVLVDQDTGHVRGMQLSTGKRLARSSTVMSDLLKSVS